MKKQMLNELFTKRVSIEFLTKDSVCVKVQNIILLDGEEQTIGENHMKSYVNSTYGRNDLQKELFEPYLTSVMSIWGKEPTVQEDLNN